MKAILNYYNFLTSLFGSDVIICKGLVTANHKKDEVQIEKKASNLYAPVYEKVVRMYLKYDRKVLNYQ